MVHILAFSIHYISYILEFLAHNWENREFYARSKLSNLSYSTPGKIGGITTPNDGRCHLTWDMRYGGSETMDYPSISHLKEKMTEHGVVPILAVTKDVEPVYRKLVEEWKDLGVGRVLHVLFL